MSVDAIGSYVNVSMNPITSAKTASTDTTTSSIEGDRVSISSEAVSLNLMTDFMGGAGEDGVITLDEMEAFRDKQTALAETILRDTFKALNIESSERMQIDIDPYNKVMVTGGTDEENKALAEALQENDEFKNAWKAASGASTLLAAAEASTAFQSAYGSDPEAAVTQYNGLFNKDWEFHMYFEDGKVAYSVI